jgi:hypothetical protein
MTSASTTRPTPQTIKPLCRSATAEASLRRNLNMRRPDGEWLAADFAGYGSPIAGPFVSFTMPSTAIAPDKVGNWVKDQSQPK